MSHILAKLYFIEHLPLIIGQTFLVVRPSLELSYSTISRPRSQPPLAGSSLVKASVRTQFATKGRGTCIDGRMVLGEALLRPIKQVAGLFENNVVQDANDLAPVVTIATFSDLTIPISRLLGKLEFEIGNSPRG